MAEHKYKFCKYLIDRHHLYPGRKQAVYLPPGRKRGPIVGHCVMTHLEHFADECNECDMRRNGPPVQTMEEYTAQSEYEEDE
jgi:hypothetical protein